MSREADVITLYESNHRDPCATLRALADDIEAGCYGEVGCVGIAVLGDTLEVIGCGPDSDGPSCASVLSAGALRLTSFIERHGQG